MATISYNLITHSFKMANFAPILRFITQLTPSELETNILFSQLGAKAIEYGKY